MVEKAKRHRRYDGPWENFASFCNNEKIDIADIKAADCINFFQRVYDGEYAESERPMKGGSRSVVEKARTAVSTTISKAFGGMLSNGAISMHANHI